MFCLNLRRCEILVEKTPILFGRSINCPRLFAIKNVEPTVGCRRSYFRTKWSEMTVCAMSMEASSVAQSF